MATKLQYISTLSEATLNDLSEQALNWTSFLKTAALNYKYPFHDQVLIYAQRHDATACAEIGVWNKLGRWVKKGSKGIALISEKQGKLELRHVFDIEDTHGYYSNYIKSWEFANNEDIVIEHLKNTFGDVQDNISTETALISISNNAVQDNLVDYLSEILRSRETSLLEGLSDIEVEDMFKDLVKRSISYTILTRCGYDADNYFTNDDFDNVIKFNTTNSISILGATCRDISEMVLLSISEVIKAKEKEEKLEDHKFAKYKEVVHNIINSENNENERRDGNEFNLQGRGRLSDSELDIRAGGSTHRQIWDASTDALKKQHEGTLFQPHANGETDESLSGNRPDSQTKSGADNGTNDGNREDARQRERPNGMGADDEQYKEQGGGISPTGTYSQLELFPTQEQQINIIEQAGHEKSSAFSFSQEDIDSVLKRGSGPDNEDRHNFRITTDELGIGGPKEKYRNNINAIKMLFKIESENRFATPDEQEVLSRYVGWGSIPEAFDANNTSWANEYFELKELLSQSEYSNARESTLNAFYTPPIVIKAMYKAIENMGFKTGNILEPSCGIGNFIGLLPESMSQSKVYGVELDSISGRIAKQLYQKSSITIQGYEKTNLQDSFFDVAIGNVPFGQYKISDKRYDKNNFLVHDYFIAKTLDKVRPGGIVAFITSSGTMDKKNSSVRKYIAQRADLVGAIRLPNNTFKANAGTEVTSDILFLQKRDRLIDIEPDWVHLGKDENDISINQYFIDNPEMILGEMGLESTQFGMDSTCRPFENAELSTLLQEAIDNIHAELMEYEFKDVSDVSNENVESIPADPSVKNFSYTIVEGDVYYRENSVMNKVEASITAINRIKGMIEIRDSVRNLITYQSEDYSDEDIKNEQISLNNLYDRFTSKYGLLNSRANNTAFSDDSSYCLLCSLEILDENGDLLRKADMFTRRTIKQHIPVTSVDTASEALTVSLGEKGKIDMPFMSELTGQTEDELVKELEGVVFRNPLYVNEDSRQAKFLTADEYLSGNVRDKLEIARQCAKLYPDDYLINVEALEKVQPKDLSASEITVRLGATWIPPDVVQDFIFEILETPRYSKWNIKVHYSNITGEWNIEGKSQDRGNVKAISTYGTGRINAYKIIEETLNLRDVRIFDYVVNENGNKTAVLNKKETTIAQQKQELIKSAFCEWLWKDPERRETLTRLYNDKFNNLRPREFDGSHLKLSGMNPEISLRPHQLNAIAHILYGGNTLLAHVVGAGKTFEMIAAAMESKRLGLYHKPLFVVPNHITEQFASEFLQLYPSANILVATKKDFETKNRKKFCGRIATGDYDAVIIGHSQFEKIPMSIERQCRLLEQQLDEIVGGIDELKQNMGERFSIKQLEKTKKTIQSKLDRLNDQSRKDDVVTFEELGVDKLFIDESHYYKNLFLYTKMRNVGGIAQTEAQKSSDLFMKCRYLDEITDGRGITFATGTPISNSMVELYTVQRYLQYQTLVKNGLQHFDAWASTFGETVTAIELSPEGTGYRAKTRFAKFYNLPELMSIFKDVADIQTADMLNLPVPKANYHNIAIEPSEIQREMVVELSERADKVRNKMVEPNVDNMLKITNDGRKLALDQRLINDMLPDDENSKVSICSNKVFEIWEKTIEDSLAQLVFCDLSTPKGDGSFSVYDDIKSKLMVKGVPENEIAFIHDAETEIKKKEMFAKVRKGQIRVLIGSTQKMGAGTNCQDKLIALHDLDCPWRPSDLEQRSGRIIRQGNQNAEVDIFRYVTKDTFDAYLFQIVENKQKFISQVMTSKSPARSAEDIDETALSYAEIKALATGNPYIKEKMDLDNEVSRLKVIKSSFLSQKYALEDAILKHFPKEIKQYEERIEGYKVDMELLKRSESIEDKFSPMIVNGVKYFEKERAGKAILEMCKKITSLETVSIGRYRGFEMDLFFDTFSREYKLTLKNKLSHTVTLGSDIFGNITRIENMLDSFDSKINASTELLENTKKQFETAKEEVVKPFPYEAELSEKSARLDELNILLNMDKAENEFVEDEPEAEEDSNVEDEKERVAENDLER